jgi:Zn-dependent protease
VGRKYTGEPNLPVAERYTPRILPAVCAQQVAPDNSGAPPPVAPRRPGSSITPIQWVGLAVVILLLLNQMGLLQLNNPGSALRLLNTQLPRFVALVLAITVHEFSHGFVATLFGDQLPRRVGRLTLNPLKHLDPLGTIMILVGPIGWGRPMPINPAGMRNPNLGWAMSSLAGPVSNLLAATVVAAVYALLSSQLDRNIFRYVDTFILVNVLLAVFNLIPIPPLDGFGFVFGLAPTPLKVALLPLQRYGMFVLLAFLFLPPLRPIVDGFIGGGLGIILPPLEDVCQCIIG